LPLLLLFFAFGSLVVFSESGFSELDVEFGDFEDRELEDVDELDPPEAESAAKSRSEVL
jgi:hypothetical protein